MYHFVKYFLVTILILLYSCTKNTEKEKLINLYNLSKQFTLSEEFKNYLKEPDEKVRNQLFDKKGEELVKKAGFKNIYEVQKTEEDLMDDEDIIKIRSEYEQIREIKIHEARIEVEQDSLLKLQQKKSSDN